MVPAQVHDLLDDTLKMVVLLKRNVARESWDPEPDSDRESDMQSALTDVRDAVKAAKKTIPVE